MYENVYHHTPVSEKAFLITGGAGFIGSNIVEYLITFSNNDNRMTWNDRTSGAVTVWDRVVAIPSESSE